MNPKVAIIIPAYNEGSVIKTVLENVLSKYGNVICIDDGSTDNTAKQVQATNAKLITHPINLGQGAAIQTGIDFALIHPETEYFVTFDSDGQHSLKDVQKMLSVIRNEKLDIVLGSRFLGSSNNMPKLKKALLKYAVIFSNRTSGTKLTDAHNGLRVFNRRVAEELNITMPDFSHASEIINRIGEKKYKYKEVPVTITYSEYSVSKGQSMFNAINIGFDVLLRKISK